MLRASGVQSDINLDAADYGLSLAQLYAQEILANPYPLYDRLRTDDPVHWDAFLHTWVVTRYCDVTSVLQNLSARCTPSPERLAAMGVDSMRPIAEVLGRQMLFMDAPEHTALRAVCTVAFTPARVSALQFRIEEIVCQLLQAGLDRGGMEMIADFAEPLPSIISAEILGVPPSDHRQLKSCSAKFAEILGNFQHNPDSIPEMLCNLDDACEYFRDAIREERKRPKDGLIHALLTAEVSGRHLAEEMVIANCILLMVGAQETTPNLIGNGLLALLRNPEQLQLLRGKPELLTSAVEELLRYDAPSQHTTRVAVADVTIAGKHIACGQSVIAVMGAANRDPERFPQPDRLDICRKNNKHLAFGAGDHFCFGASLARLEGRIAFSVLLEKTPGFLLDDQPLTWRQNLGLRGLNKLPITFGPR
jgi:cytochrome P450